MRSPLLEIIDDALWAPTPDNAQNWEFHLLGPMHLQVKIDTSEWDHPLDPYYHCCLLSLGGLCEYMVIAAAHRGWQTEWNFNEEEMSLSLQFVNGGEELSTTAAYYSALKTRRTSRSAYRKGGPSVELVEKLLATNNCFNSSVYLNTAPDSELFHYLYRCEKHLWGVEGAAQATFKFIEMSERIPRRGFNYLNAGMKRAEARFFSWMVSHQRVYRTFLKLGLARMIGGKVSGNYRRAAGMFLISVAGQTHRDLFEVGRHGTRCWLILTQAQMVAQPLTFSSLSCFDQKCGPRKHFPFIESAGSLFQQGNEILSQSFCLQGHQTPCWLFRFGQAHAVEKEIPTSRLSADDFPIDGLHGLYLKNVSQW